MQGREELLQELRALQAKCSELMNKIEQDEESQGKPQFERVREDELYYLVSFTQGQAIADREREDCCGVDDARFNNNNYFRTPERAAQVADKINALLKLERLHDMFCPDYVPDWDDSETEKWHVFVDSTTGLYDINSVVWAQHETTVYFPTVEIVKQVRDILNKELEEKT